MAFFVIILNS